MQEPIELSPVEARILGVLVEKQATVPDTYPLSLNALVTGCNQKTGRDPVMEISEPQAMEAMDELRSRDLIIESSGGRVSRYAHNVGRVFQLPPPAVALISMLMLRGPQTAAELRTHCDRPLSFRGCVLRGGLSRRTRRTRSQPARGDAAPPARHP